MAGHPSAENEECSLSPMDLNSLVGTRVRLQRLKDARYFAGWIEAAAGNLIHVAINNPGDLSEGDDVFGEAHSFHQRMNIKATIDRRIGDGANVRFVLRVKQEPVLLPGVENPRFRVPSTTAKFTFEGGESFGIVEDASVAGLGLLLESKIERGQVGLVLMEGVTGQIEAKIEIRHALELPEIEKFRCGALIQGMERDSAERWVKLIRLIACGSKRAA